MTQLIPDFILNKAGVVDYKKLEKVQNGVICQSLAIGRAIENQPTELKNFEWAYNTHLMKKYCENDVRSMIAVVYFIEDLITQATMGQKVLF